MKLLVCTEMVNIDRHGRGTDMCYKHQVSVRAQGKMRQKK